MTRPNGFAPAQDNTESLGYSAARYAEIHAVSGFIDILKSKRGADIASASTTDLSTATGTSFNITGTTAITSLGTVQSGVFLLATFTGVLTLTHNATSLILPTGANITTAAGDTALFVSLGSGNWKCANYQRASGDSVKSAINSLLTNFNNAATAAAVAATDTILAAIEKLYAYIQIILGWKVQFTITVYPNTDLTSTTVDLRVPMTVDRIYIAVRTDSNATKSPSSSTNSVLYKDGSSLDTRAFTVADTSFTGLSVSLAAGIYDLRLSGVNGLTGAKDKVSVTFSGVRA